MLKRSSRHSPKVSGTKKVLICILSLFVLSSSVFTPIFAQEGANGEKTGQPSESDVVVVNTALALDGNDSYVEIFDSETLNNITKQVTVSAWLKPTDFPKRYTNILFKGNKRLPGIRHRQFTFWLRDDGAVQFDTSPNGQDAQYLMSRPGALEINEWSHVAGTIDAEKDVMKLYINGIEIAMDDFDGEEHILKTILPLRIGCSHEEEMAFHAAFVGNIDEVRVWNIARTEADIRADMRAHLNGDEPGLVAYWKFDEQTDRIVSDASPNRNHGRLIGTAKLVDYIRPVVAITDTEQLATATSAYQEFLTRETNYYEAYRYLAEIYIETERFAEAEKLYLRALDAHLTQAEHNDAIRALHKLYTDRDAGEAFVTLLEELRPRMEKSAILHELLGDAYKAAGETEKAEIAYTRWIEIRKREINRRARVDEYHTLAEKLLSKNIFPKVALEFALHASELRLSFAYELTLTEALLINGIYEAAFQVIAANLDEILPPYLERQWFARLVAIGRRVKNKEGYVDMLERLIADMPHNPSARFNAIFALAQFYRENDAPEKAKELIQKTGFVAEDDWIILGPFDNTDGIGYDTVYIPENLPQIDPTTEYDGKYGKIRWRKHADEILNGYISLGEEDDWRIAYAFAIVTSPDEREVQLRFDSDDQGVIWLNGIEVFSHTKTNTAEIDNYTIPVTLNAGKNSILIKVCEEIGGWGFYLRITDTDGNSFEDLKIDSTEQN